MKKLFCSLEGVWKEFKKVELTQEERDLLKSTGASDKEAREALMERVRLEREVAASAEDAALAEEAYIRVKPVLKEGDTYQLIGVDCVVDSGHVYGIVNCRVNGDHKQIRF